MEVMKSCIKLGDIDIGCREGKRQAISKPFRDATLGKNEVSTPNEGLGVGGQGRNEVHNPSNAKLGDAL